MRYAIFLSIFLCLGVFKSLNAQDPEFTQYYANPLYLNPAFAGSERCPRLILNSRDQWPSIGAFLTYHASYDQHVPGIGGGFGLMVMQDNQGSGIIKSTTVSGVYSYHIPVSRKFSVRTGLQATFAQSKLDWDMLIFPDEIDPHYGFIRETSEENTGITSTMYPDFSAGVLGYSDRFYAGISVHHLTQPDVTFMGPLARLPMKITFHSGFRVALDKSRGKRAESFLSPNILYQKQHQFQQLNMGLYLQQNVFVAGVWFRHDFTNPDSFILLLGFQQSALKFGYSYDLTVSKFGNNASGGSHEFSLAVTFPCRTPKRKIRPITCPSF